MTSRLAIAAAALAALSAVAMPAGEDDAPPPAPAGSHVVTLRAFDDLDASVDFDGGGSGAFVDAGVLDRDAADLIYQEDGALAFGFRYRERAVLVDCGDARVVPTGAPRGFAPPPPVSVLHTLFLAGGKLNYIGASGQVETFGGAKMLFGPYPPEGTQLLEPVIGSVYLLRYRAPASGPKEGRVVAFRVVDVEPGRDVTLRYRVLN